MTAIILLRPIHPEKVRMSTFCFLNIKEVLWPFSNALLGSWGLGGAEGQTSWLLPLIVPGLYLTCQWLNKKIFIICKNYQGCGLMSFDWQLSNSELAVISFRSCWILIGAWTHMTTLASPGLYSHLRLLKETIFDQICNYQWWLGSSFDVIPDDTYSKNSSTIQSDMWGHNLLLFRLYCK